LDRGGTTPLFLRASLTKSALNCPGTGRTSYDAGKAASCRRSPKRFVAASRRCVISQIVNPPDSQVSATCRMPFSETADCQAGATVAVRNLQ